MNSIIDNNINILYAHANDRLELSYSEILIKIDRAEIESFTMADEALAKASIQGPRQSDLSYNRALALAQSRYERTSQKITAHFQRLRDLVDVDKEKKMVMVDLNYENMIKRADRELLKNETRSASDSLISFMKEISSIGSGGNS